MRSRLAPAIRLRLAPSRSSILATSTVRSAFRVRPGRACRVQTAPGKPSEQISVGLQSQALKPRPATWQGRSSLVQAHLQVALRDDLENFMASAWQYAELIAALEHHMEPRFVGAQDPSQRKGAHTTLIESAGSGVAVHVAPPL